MIRTFRNAALLSMLVGTLAFTSCKDNKTNEEDAEVEMQMREGGAEMSGNSEAISEENQVKTTGMAAFNDEQIAMAYEGYLDLKDALVNTDAKAAATASKKLENSSNAKVASLAAEISNNEDINMQREKFSELTAEMEPMLNDALDSGKIYKQFCPMAFEGKGDYWFSDSEQIRNPYFGDKMLKCGRVEKTIE